jgi:hypothetical protein
MATEVDPARVMPTQFSKRPICKMRGFWKSALGWAVDVQCASQPRSVIGIDTTELDIRSLASQDQLDYDRSITKEAYE